MNAGTDYPGVTTLTRDELADLSKTYRHALLDDTLAFWFPRIVDHDHGGYMTCRDRDGSLVDTDKGVWQQARTAWMCATIHNSLDGSGIWAERAESGIRFLTDHCFDSDGRMFFHMDQQGNPIRKRRYFFSECFTAMALAAQFRATRNDAHAARAVELFHTCLGYFRNPGLLESKFTANRPMHSIGPPMILIGVAQQLRQSLDSNQFNPVIDELIDWIQRYFVRPELECVMESVGVDGSIVDHFDGRLLNPGHAIECAWFILHESHVRKDVKLTNLGINMLEWMWARGWDQEYGGLLYYTDLDGKPVSEYWHDMKFWWPHCEAEIATLLAALLTSDPRFIQWHEKVRTYSLNTFADPIHGEWFGYVHRDGRLSSTLKGNLWKGPFHLPRMQHYCWWILNEFTLVPDGMKT